MYLSLIGTTYSLCQFNLVVKILANLHMCSKCKCVIFVTHCTYSDNLKYYT